MEDDFWLRYYKEKSERIKTGELFLLYLEYCTACKVYKRILASCPAGPGGTLSCPLCRANKQNGPGIENSYGNIRVRTFSITLPEGI